MSSVASVPVQHADVQNADVQNADLQTGWRAAGICRMGQQPPGSLAARRHGYRRRNAEVLDHRGGGIVRGEGCGASDASIFDMWPRGGLCLVECCVIYLEN